MDVYDTNEIEESHRKPSMIAEKSIRSIKDSTNAMKNVAEKSVRTIKKSKNTRKSVTAPKKLTIAEKILRSRQPSSTFMTEEAVAPSTSINPKKKKRPYCHNMIYQTIGSVLFHRSKLGRMNPIFVVHHQRLHSVD